jgi:uncharacterized membrane protein
MAKTTINESRMDRLFRLVGGVALIFIGFYAVGVAKYVGWLVGAVLLLTALTGYCHLYKMLGVSTLTKKKR